MAGDASAFAELTERSVADGMTGPDRHRRRQPDRTDLGSPDRPASAGLAAAGSRARRRGCWVCGSRARSPCWPFSRATCAGSPASPVAPRRSGAARWPTSAARGRGRAGHPRPVRLAITRELAVPVSWGLRRPVVLLPAAARRWDAERRRVVLRHELAHVRRGDYAGHLLIELACALHWPNPLRMARGASGAAGAGAGLRRSRARARDRSDRRTRSTCSTSPGHSSCARRAGAGRARHGGGGDAARAHALHPRRRARPSAGRADAPCWPWPLPPCSWAMPTAALHPWSDARARPTSSPSSPRHRIR